MDFVDEQYVVRFEVGQKRGQIARAFQYRAAGLAQVHAQFFGDDVGQRGFAQARRTEKQRVVECFAAFFGCLDKDFKLFFGLVLADVVGKQLRAQRAFELLFLG